FSIDCLKKERFISSYTRDVIQQRGKNHMDENHQNESGNTTMAAKDVAWKLKVDSKLWVPEHAKSGWFRGGFEDKTSWDWFQLLAQMVGAFAIPLSLIGLIIGVWQFNTQQTNSAQMQATQVAESAIQSLDQQQETTLDTYLDRMSDLLIVHNLRGSR